MAPSLDDAAAALPARDDFFGLPMDPTWQEVNRYPPRGDGHEVVVSVARMPARFWLIECPDLDLDLVTGSGMHKLVDSIADAIAGGMLGVGDEP